MIRIYRGPRESNDRHLAHLAKNSSRAILLYDPSELPLEWSGIRTILTMVRHYSGKAHWDEVIANHRAAVACACPEMPMDFSEEDRAVQAHILARVETHSNRNHQICGRVSAMLADLLDGQGISLFVPDPDHLDFVSFSILKHLFTYHRDRAPEFHLGVHEIKSSKTCDRHIFWSWSPDSLENEISGLLLAKDSKVITGADGEPASCRELSLLQADEDQLLGPLPEAGAFGALAATARLDETTFELVYQAVESGFRRHSFRGALKLALTLMNRASQLGGDYLGRIQALTGAVAHFYHFSHEPSPVFDKFLESCFRGGLTAKLPPSFQLACRFRLLFTVAERMGNPKRAKPDLDRYMEVLPKLDLPPLEAAYQNSWAHFIGCYITAHVGKKEQAHRINLRAYEFLEEGKDHLSGLTEGDRRYWSEELEICRFNLAAHSVYLGERLRWFDFNEYWYQVAEPLTYGQPKAVHFEVYHWVHHHRFTLNYKEALRRAERGIADALACCHGGMYYIFLFSAADLCDRMGQAAKAVKYLERAVAARPRHCNLFQVASHQYLLGKAQFRAGTDAKPALEAALQELHEKDFSGRFSARGYLAQMAAREGRAEDAESILNQLVDEAEAIGARDLMVAVLLHGADTCDRLGRHEESLQASIQAWEILSDNLQEAVKARQVVAALRRLPRHTITPDQLRGLVRPFRRELNYGDTWWLLKDFLSLALDATTAKPELFNDPKLAGHLEFLSSAAGVRKDCAQVLSTLRETPGQAAVWQPAPLLAATMT